MKKLYEPAVHYPLIKKQQTDTAKDWLVNIMFFSSYGTAAIDTDVFNMNSPKRELKENEYLTYIHQGGHKHDSK